MKAYRPGPLRERCVGQHGGCELQRQPPCLLGVREARLRSAATRALQRSCRCQATPEASGGGSLFNLRAWGAGVVSGLKLGQAEGPRGAVPEPDCDDEAAPPAPVPAPGADSSWDEWQQYFRDIDDALERTEEVHVALEAAVAGELYGEAARLRGDLAELETRDTMGGMLREYAAALKQEDYATAGRLRDEGGLGLAGWWHARSDAEPCGHLLRIAPEFGRLSGLMYTSRNLAQLKGWTNEPASAFPASAFLASQADVQQVEVTFEEAGVPCLEVFIAQGPDGKLRQQASVLRPASPSPSDSAADDSFEEALAAVGANSGDLRVMVDAEAVGGQDVISISLATEDHHFSRPAPDAPGPDLPNGGAGPSGMDGMSGGSSLGDLVHDLSELVSAAGGDGDIDSPDEVLSDAHQQMVLIEESSGGDDDDGHIDISGSSEYVRAPAEILRSSRNSFVLSAPAAADPDEPDADPTDPNPSHAKSMIASDLSAMVAAGPGELLAALQRRVAELAGGNDRVSNPEGLKPSRRADASATALPPPGSGGEVAADAEAGRGDAGKDGEGNAAGGPLQPRSKSPWVKVAGEVRRVHEAKNPGRPLPMDDAKLAEVIRSAAASAILSMQRDASHSSFCLEGEVAYTRLRTDYPRTDPFSGLYLGAFGSVGAQALQLQRFTWEDGEEGVQAVKLTGDRNVPAGAITFRAKVGRQHRLRCEDAYPPELGVTARYRGQGRIAGRGFSNPKWVDGELLLLGGGVAAVKDAELGFVWNIPHERRYLILLSRIELDDPLADHLASL